MKKVFVGVFVVLLAMSSPLFADTISVSNTLTFDSAGVTSSGDGMGTLLDYGRGTVNKLDGILDYVMWSQTFVFNPPADNSTVKGKLSLTLRDDSSSSDCKFWIDGPEFAIGWTNTGQLAIGEVDTGTYSYNVGLDNGKLVVTLKSLGGDFYIDKAVLDVSYTPAATPAPVPEPASLLLLGVGMISAGFFTRKRNKQS